MAHFREHEGVSSMHLTITGEDVSRIDCIQFLSETPCDLSLHNCIANGTIPQHIV